MLGDNVAEFQQTGFSIRSAVRIGNGDLTETGVEDLARSCMQALTVGRKLPVAYRCAYAPMAYLQRRVACHMPQSSAPGAGPLTDLGGSPCRLEKR